MKWSLEFLFIGLGLDIFLLALKKYFFSQSFVANTSNIAATEGFNNGYSNIHLFYAALIFIALGLWAIGIINNWYENKNQQNTEEVKDEEQSSNNSKDIE